MPLKSILFFLIVFLGIGAAAETEFVFKYKACMIPHPQKAHRGGEDAFYISDTLLAIADGVGGWASLGVDPGYYARYLCSEAGREYDSFPEIYAKDPLELLRSVHQKNLHEGSSTFEVLTLGGGSLHSCYLGDSGFVILRRYDRSYVAIFRTEEQQHGFNHPFQLSMDPAEGDTPDDAICVSIAVRVGDIVLAASDGLLDNVFEEELVRSVNQAKQNGTLLTDLPDRLAELAITRGENSTFHSPFAAKAESNGYTFKGGKLDDTTIIIAQIVEKTSFGAVVNNSSSLA